LANHFTSPEGLERLWNELPASNNNDKSRLLNLILGKDDKDETTFSDSDSKLAAAKQGVDNLFGFLSARFTSKEEKVHLALLFSMLSNRALQPTKQIYDLLHQVDTSTGNSSPRTTVDEETLKSLQRNAIQLLPTNLRPTFEFSSNSYSLPAISSPFPDAEDDTAAPVQYYRSLDPLFGGLGTSPVTKGAQSLSANQYTRLALSGALSTVAVRTILNPLELVKTKMQLQNDIEFNKYVARDSEEVDQTSKPCSKGLVTQDEEQVQIHTLNITNEVDSSKKSVGTIKMMLSLVRLRGPAALLQSADATLLASIVFGSFGYGATELFRRWFAFSVLSDSANTDSGFQSEMALLAAAAFACIIMCAAATPFEVLRVRSMATIEPKQLIEVFDDFIVRYLFLSLPFCYNMTVAFCVQFLTQCTFL
jgi:hypothetical protein